MRLARQQSKPPQLDLLKKVINSLNHNLELGLSEEHASGMKKVGKEMLSVSCKKDLY